MHSSKVKRIMARLSTRSYVSIEVMLLRRGRLNWKPC